MKLWRLLAVVIVLVKAGPSAACSPTETFLDVGESIVITSPNYPDEYDAASTTCWRVSTDNSNLLSALVKQLDTEDSYDNLHFYNGYDDTSSSIEILSGSYTDTTVAGYSQLGSDPTYMYILFTSDSSVQDSGFNLCVYRQDDGSDSCEFDKGWWTAGRIAGVAVAAVIGFFIFCVLFNIDGIRTKIQENKDKRAQNAVHPTTESAARPPYPIQPPAPPRAAQSRPEPPRANPQPASRPQRTAQRAQVTPPSPSSSDTDSLASRRLPLSESHTEPSAPPGDFPPPSYSSMGAYPPEPPPSYDEAVRTHPPAPAAPAAVVYPPVNARPAVPAAAV